MSADDALFFGFGENIHDAFVALGPIAFGEAMHQTDIDVVSAKFAAEALEIGAGSGGVASPGLGEDGDFVAGDAFEGFRDMRVAAVRISGVKEAQAMVVAVEEQVRETLDAEGGLMRMVAGADGAGAHGEAAGLDAGLTESHGVSGAEFSGECGESRGTAREGGSVEREGAGGASDAMEEFTAFHGGLPVAAFPRVLLISHGRTKQDWVIRRV